jgi:hypothetical protein
MIMEDKIKKCKHEHCNDPEKEGCLLGDDYHDCTYYISDKNKSIDDRDYNNERNLTSEKYDEKPIIWTGEVFGGIDLYLLSKFKRPKIIALIGPYNAGKTSVLTALYILLRAGNQIKNYSFAGSYTLNGWEYLAHFLTYKGEKGYKFPPHTSRNAGRVPGLLHLCMKDNYGIYNDLLFTDAPGEWFTDWAENANNSNSEGAKWINEHADAFILFSDCDAFSKNIGKTRKDLRLIFNRLKSNIENRPVAFTWSKSDINIDGAIKTEINEMLKNEFQYYEKFNVSIKDKELLNNIVAAFEWILNFKQIKKKIASIDVKNYEDFFFAIR